MKFLSLLAIILLSANLSIAQEIEMKKSFGGYNFYQNGEHLNKGELYDALAPNPESLSMMQNAQNTELFSTILGFAGGFFIGRTLAQVVISGEPNWAVGGIGAGLALISIPLSSNAKQKKIQAVKLFNESLDSESFFEYKPEYRIVTSGSDFRLSISF
ncbi:MAG: hypothetical protein GYB31_01510 [Bacteroidetes bacterium]|nr:hypothetical protein [Bacteroidota bacterium]